MIFRLPTVGLAALVLLAGCGGNATVSGVVTLDGQALPGGTVTFHPTGSGPVAIGTIGPDGRYELAVGTDRTIPPGEYVVTVDATESTGSDEVPSKGPPQPPRPPRRITPDKYADKGTSDLRFAVQAGTNKIDLPLKKK